MDSPVVTTTPNEAYELTQQGKSKEEEEEEIPQYEVMCGPTASSTQHPLPPVPSPVDAPTESVDKAEEQAMYELIPADK